MRYRVEVFQKEYTDERRNAYFSRRRGVMHFHDLESAEECVFQMNTLKDMHAELYFVFRLYDNRPLYIKADNLNVEISSLKAQADAFSEDQRDVRRKAKCTSDERRERHRIALATLPIPPADNDEED